MHRLLSHISSFKQYHAKISLWPTLLGLLLCAFIGISESKSVFTISKETLQSVREQYGENAHKRLLVWQRLIREDASITDLEKLEKVNDFFNQMRFISDKKHWGKSDYWTTPVEFLATNHGDCEDFSLAKYFTLKAIGVPEHKLNMTYVKALRYNQAHMVVTYYGKPSAIPLVLDNIDKKIKPATKRSDLVPVFSFNGSGLWIAKARGKGKQVKGGNEKLKSWNNLLSRLPAGLK